VLLVYLCALNSKEMAVSLPMMLLAYEWLYHRPHLGRASAAAWLRGPGRVPLLAAGLTLVFCYGRVLRDGGLMHAPGYGVAISWERLVDFQVRSFRDLFVQPEALGAGSVAAIWAVLTYLAWRRDRPILQLCWWFLVIAPLPIEFLPGRAGACLAIPFVGLALFASVVFVDVAHTVAGFLAGERAFARLGRRNLYLGIAVLGAFLWAWHNCDLQERYIKSSMAQLGQPTWEVIEQLSALHPKVSRNAAVVFLNDPFPGFDMEFIAELWFHDHTVIVRLPRKIPVSHEDLAKAERVFDFREGKLVQLR
jgi:hypothetical protein